MVNNAELKQKLRRYSNLMEEIQTVIRDLNASINNLNKCDKRLGDYYTIDDISFDHNHILKCKNDIINKVEFLEHTMIPTIQKEIVKLKQKIAIASATEI